MSSLVTKSTGNCELGHDCRRVRSHRRRNSTRQLSNVGGVYWALLCISPSIIIGRPVVYVSLRLYVFV